MCIKRFHLILREKEITKHTKFFIYNGLKYYKENSLLVKINEAMEIRNLEAEDRKSRAD